MRRLLISVAVLALVAAACSDDDSGATTTTATTAASTTTAGVTTTAATTTTATGAAVFVITQVAFGDRGYVAISNVGSADGVLSEVWLCQRPAYYEIPEISVGSGQTVWVATGDGGDLNPPPEVVQVFGAEGGFGSFNAASGEIGLYTSTSFGDPNAILSYVEWGSSDHGRSSVAVEAGIWGEGEFVEVPEGTSFITIGQIPATTGAQWLPDAGV